MTPNSTKRQRKTNRTPRAAAAAPVWAPQTLTVVYDDHCQLCLRCRAWLQRSTQLVPLAFVAASDEAGVRQLGLDPSILPVGDELIVVGQPSPEQPQPIWVGPDAFITCLWALAEHRDLSIRLQKPALRPVAKRAFHALSLGRGTISSALASTAPFVDAADCGPTCQPSPGS